MTTFGKVLLNFVGIAFLLVALFVSLAWPVWSPLTFLALLYGWFLFANFHHRYLRQEELLHVLSTAAEAQAPLGPVLRAYLQDRWPRDGFDREVEHLASLLESGESLAAALHATPDLLTPETQLAATVGELSGRLAPCLKDAPRWHMAPVWLEVLPRFFYPLFLLFLINIEFLYNLIFVIPNYQKIFADFHLRLPEPTVQAMVYGKSLVRVGGVSAILMIGVGGLIGLLFGSSRARWYCPGLGRVTRMQVQSRTLSMLGVLLEAERSLPEALDVLADSGYYSQPALARVGAVREDIENGEELAPSLHRHGLLPARMVALVQAAERTQRLPATLTELGAHLARRAVRLVRQVSLLCFPVTVVGVGVILGFLALAWFLPLIHLITGLNRW